MNRSDDQPLNQVTVLPSKTVIELQKLNHRYDIGLVLSGLNALDINLKVRSTN